MIKCCWSDSMALTKTERQELTKEVLKELQKSKEVYVEVCREDISIPEYAHVGDAGMDIRAAKDTDIHPNETVIIPTGLKVSIPMSYEIQVRPRSGLSYKTPLRIANTPGTIDSGYKDEIGVIVTNTSVSGDNIYELDEKGNKPGIYHISKGSRIAQIVLCKVEQIQFVKVLSVAAIGTNRGGGFGHTGVK